MLFFLHRYVCIYIYICMSSGKHKILKRKLRTFYCLIIAKGKTSSSLLISYIVYVEQIMRNTEMQVGF